MLMLLTLACGLIITSSFHLLIYLYYFIKHKYNHTVGVTKMYLMWGIFFLIFWPVFVLPKLFVLVSLSSKLWQLVWPMLEKNYFPSLISNSWGQKERSIKRPQSSATSLSALWINAVLLSQKWQYLEFCAWCWPVERIFRRMTKGPIPDLFFFCFLFSNGVKFFV